MVKKLMEALEARYFYGFFVSVHTYNKQCLAVCCISTGFGRNFLRTFYLSPMKLDLLNFC